MFFIISLFFFASLSCRLDVTTLVLCCVVCCFFFGFFLLPSCTEFPVLPSCCCCCCCCCCCYWVSRRPLLSIEVAWRGGIKRRRKEIKRKKANTVTPLPLLFFWSPQKNDNLHDQIYIQPSSLTCSFFSCVCVCVCVCGSRCRFYRVFHYRVID